MYYYLYYHLWNNYVKTYLIKKAYCDGKLQKDDVMSVNLVVNKAPVAVGTAALSSEDMYMSGKDLYQVQETLKKLRELSIVQADRAVFGSTGNFCNLAKGGFKSEGRVGFCQLPKMSTEKTILGFRK